MRRDKFPLVDDNENFQSQSPLMDLYDDGDLISNIDAYYQERQFTSQVTQPETGGEVRTSSATYQAANREMPDLGDRPTRRTVQAPDKFSYTQVARALARADLQKKRSAPYLNFNKPGFKSKELPKPKPTQRDLDKLQVDHLTAAADRLRQTSYILAEIKPSYQPPAPSPVEETKKNSYDFLKTSQVYNYQTNQNKRPQKASQELNLTRFEQRKKL